MEETVEVLVTALREISAWFNLLITVNVFQIRLSTRLRAVRLPTRNAVLPPSAAIQEPCASKVAAVHTPHVFRSRLRIVQTQARLQHLPR